MHLLSSAFYSYILNLKFNAAKTHFSQHPHSQCDELFLFCGFKLSFTKEVTHLGRILTQDLDDSADISRAIRDLVRKTLCTFSFADPFIKCTLIKSYCLSLYGSQLSNIKILDLQIVLNKILRRIWNLPFNSHN